MTEPHDLGEAVGVLARPPAGAGRGAREPRGSSWDHLNSAPGGQSWLRRLDRPAEGDQRRRPRRASSRSTTRFRPGRTARPASTPSAARSRPSRSCRSTSPPNGPVGLVHRPPARALPQGSRARTRSARASRPPARTRPDAVRKSRRRRDRRARDLQRAEPPLLAAGGHRGRGRADDPLGDVAVAHLGRHDDPRLRRPRTSRTSGPRQLARHRQHRLGGLHVTACSPSSRGFRPPVPIHWSHHNYRETRFGEAPRRTDACCACCGRAGRCASASPCGSRRAASTWARAIRTPPTRERQARLIERSFRRTMRVRGGLHVDAAHDQRQAGQRLEGRAARRLRVGQGLGGPRPAWYTWRDLPGARTR